MGKIIFSLGLLLFALYAVFVAYFVKSKKELTKEQELNWKLASYGKLETDRCTTKIGDYAKYFNDKSTYKGWK